MEIICYYDIENNLQIINVLENFHYLYPNKNLEPKLFFDTVIIKKLKKIGYTIEGFISENIINHSFEHI